MTKGGKKNISLLSPERITALVTRTEASVSVT